MFIQFVYLCLPKLFTVLCPIQPRWIHDTNISVCFPNLCSLQSGTLNSRPVICLSTCKSPQFCENQKKFSQLKGDQLNPMHNQKFVARKMFHRNSVNFSRNCSSGQNENKVCFANCATISPSLGFLLVKSVDTKVPLDPHLVFLVLEEKAHFHAPTKKVAIDDE